MITLEIPDMSCGHCKAAVERALTGADPGAAVAVDLPARRATVAGAAAPALLVAALDAAGFPARVAADGA
ncbi:MAG: heavy-metal-associated domain-containing protein [Paracoccaceae bacterium]|nr:MAG: heavy-metal-associated domain-containing protein [Paracoccaceae bacterium]